MSDYSRLEQSRIGDILVVRPLPRILGPWEGHQEPPTEAAEFRDQLNQLMTTVAGPLLLDLQRYEFIRNWNWFLFPLLQECKEHERRLALCVLPAVADVLRLTKFDQLFATFTVFDEAVASLSGPWNLHNA